MWPFTRRTEQPKPEPQGDQARAEVRPIRPEMPLLSQASRIAPHVFQAWKTLCVQQGTTTVKRLKDLIEREVQDLGGNGDPIEFASLCQQMGIPPAQRVVELMERDLMDSGQEVPQPGPTPGSLQQGVLEAVRRANKEIDDSFTAAEVAREMGIRVQELSNQFLGQVAELTVALSDVSAKYGTLVRQLQSAPDFTAWTTKLEQAISTMNLITKQQQDIVDRAEMIIENQNAITELFKKFSETAVTTIVNNVVGRLGDQIDQRLTRLNHLDKLEGIGRSLTDLITVNNKIVELLERRK